MHRRFLLMALCAAASVPALAAGTDKLALLRSLGLDQGQWTTTVTIADMTVTPDAALAGDPATKGKIEDALKQKGRTFETTDCIGDGLAADGDLVLPGVSIDAECAVGDSSVSPEKFALSARCGENGEFTVRMDAAKSRTSIDGTLAVQTRGGGLTTDIRLTTRSRWTGACPAR